MINLSLSAGIFPSDWKVATVVPLYKGGDNTSKGNYRPISPLTVPDKLLEKIVHGLLSNHLEGNNLLTHRQSGFRKGFSTISSIVSLTNYIFTGINNKQVTVALFVDLAKAFNAVNHNILLAKIVKMGVFGKLLTWGVKVIWS